MAASRWQKRWRTRWRGDANWLPRRFEGFDSLGCPTHTDLDLEEVAPSIARLVEEGLSGEVYQGSGGDDAFDLEVPRLLVVVL